VGAPLIVRPTACSPWACQCPLSALPALACVERESAGENERQEWDLTTTIPLLKGGAQRSGQVSSRSLTHGFPGAWHPMWASWALGLRPLGGASVMQHKSQGLRPGWGVSHSSWPTSQGQACHLENFEGISKTHFLEFLLKQHLLENMSKHLGSSFWFRICQCFHLETEVFLLMW
jgi:hypothetical protein